MKNLKSILCLTVLLTIIGIQDIFAIQLTSSGENFRKLILIGPVAEAERESNHPDTIRFAQFLNDFANRAENASELDLNEIEFKAFLANSIEDAEWGSFKDLGTDIEVISGILQSSQVRETGLYLYLRLIPAFSVNEVPQLEVLRFVYSSSVPKSSSVEILKYSLTKEFSQKELQSKLEWLTTKPFSFTSQSTTPDSPLKFWTVEDQLGIVDGLGRVSYPIEPISGKLIEYCKNAGVCPPFSYELEGPWISLSDPQEATEICNAFNAQLIGLSEWLALQTFSEYAGTGLILESQERSRIFSSEKNWDHLRAKPVNKGLLFCTKFPDQQVSFVEYSRGQLFYQQFDNYYFYAPNGKFNENDVSFYETFNGGKLIGLQDHLELPELGIGQVVERGNFYIIFSPSSTPRLFYQARRYVPSRGKDYGIFRINQSNPKIKFQDHEGNLSKVRATKNGVFFGSGGDYQSSNLYAESGFGYSVYSFERQNFQKDDFKSSVSSGLGLSYEFAGNYFVFYDVSLGALGSIALNFFREESQHSSVNTDSIYFFSGTFGATIQFWIIPRVNITFASIIETGGGSTRLDSSDSEDDEESNENEKYKLLRNISLMPENHILMSLGIRW